MGSPTPSISVIVPTYGRPADLGKCLASLADLDYPCNAFEVVVVDDGSPSPLDEVVAPFRQRFQLQLQRQSQKGPGAARNTGLGVAKGEFVAFTADDCAPAPDWLRRLAACFVRSPGSAVGGRIVNALPNNPFSTSTDLLIRYLYDYYNRVPDQARFFTPNNLAFPVQPLRALGGFTPSFLTGEDRDLCERWRAAGHALMYAPDVVVTHAHPLDLVGFCRLHFQYGQGSSRFRRSSSMRSDPIGFEPLSFYLNLVRYPFGRSSVARAVLLSGLLGVAQVANATGFLYQSFTRFREDRPA
jgi:glycosyltransferase involved in cell wall biosynthesis